MALVGRALLVLALLVCVYGIVASLYGARTGRQGWVDSGRRSVYALSGVAVIAFAILVGAFLRNDFSYNVVAQTSSTTTPTAVQGGGGLVDPGRLAAAVGVAALLRGRAWSSS